MTHKMYGALVASVSVAALMLAANETFARSGAAAAAAPVAAHSMSRPFFARPFQHHRRNNVGPFWPATGGFFYEPSNGEPPVDAMQPASGNFHYTYSYDVPWDWTHRYPLTLPSDRPYVPSCATETVTVPGRYGIEQAVNVMRCY